MSCGWVELKVQRQGWQPPFVAMAHAAAGRDGVAEFPRVHAVGAEVRVFVEGPAGAGVSEPVQLVSGRTTEVSVAVRRPGRVEGVVRDAAGVPLVGVRVSLRNHDLATGLPTDGGWTVVPTDRQGRYAFTGVPPGGHFVELGLHRKADGVARSAPFAVDSGATVLVDLQVPK